MAAVCSLGTDGQGSPVWEVRNDGGKPVGFRPRHERDHAADRYGLSRYTKLFHRGATKMKTRYMTAVAISMMYAASVQWHLTRAIPAKDTGMTPIAHAIARCARVIAAPARAWL